MVLLSHPTGNAFVREAALSLEESGFLGELHTSIASCGGNAFEKLARLPGFGEIRRRSLPPELRPKLRLHPFREACRLALARLGPQASSLTLQGFCGVDAIYRSLDHRVSRRIPAGNFRAVYCYEDGALETFRAAKARGLKCIYDLPIAHWTAVRNLLSEAADRSPEWACTLDGLRDPKEKLRRKDEELELADVIICPSRFVRDSLPADVVARKHVEIVPFGSPSFAGSAPKSCREGPLKVLFAGSMTQRKGLADVFAAIALVDSRKIELHVLGTPVAGMAFYRSRCPNFIHHHTRSNAAVLELMRSCDVLVLPSIVEGRALVQQEAMACGLPVIATRNAGAEDLLEDGAAGFLVPVGSPESIAEKLESLSNDPALLEKMGEAARQKAQRLPWSEYRRQISVLVKELLGGRPL
jgi:glycosyltransferase involved in cell wall biosynthesis